jgi:zinc protease
VEGGTQDSARYKLPRGLMEDYTKVTPEQLQALARHWLQSDRAFRLQVLPEAKGKTAKAD